MKRFFALLTILVILNFPFSCNPCGDSGILQKFEIASIGSEIGSCTGGLFSTIASSNHQNSAIRVKVNEIRHVNLSQLLYRLNFMSVTYACSPVEPEVQLLSQISITSTISVFLEGLNINQMIT